MNQFNEGDRVYVDGHDTYPAVIARVTKTMAVIGEGLREIRFNRETGRLIGGSTWSMQHIAHPTPELDARYARALVTNARQRLNEATRLSDAGAIRRAFAHWDKLTKELEEK